MKAMKKAMKQRAAAVAPAPTAMQAVKKAMKKKAAAAPASKAMKPMKKAMKKKAGTHTPHHRATRTWAGPIAVPSRQSTVDGCGSSELAVRAPRVPRQFPHRIAGRAVGIPWGHEQLRGSGWCHEEVCGHRSGPMHRHPSGVCSQHCSSK